MTTKPNILIFIDWFLPGFKAGGPIKSVSNMVNSLGNDFNFYIITSDRDIDDENPYANEILNKWVNKSNYNIAYLSKERRKEFIINTLSNQQYNTIYFNSLFSKNYTLDPIRIIKKYKIESKVIIAPRGMLGKGALQIKSFKKRVFLSLARLTGFYKSISWHATDQEELNDIKRTFGDKTTVTLVPNISILNIQKALITKKENELKLVFFSRISPKKNLFRALEILKNINHLDIEMDIYGSIEDEIYWNKCNDFIIRNKIKANYIKKLNPSEVQNTLGNYHFLFFPTHHENYGHVIVEALSAGCGLILSTNTPWRHLDRNKIGWDIPLHETNKFVEVIEYCAKMNQQEYDSYRKNCYQYIKDETDKFNAVELTKKMFSV